MCAIFNPNPKIENIFTEKISYIFWKNFILSSGMTPD